MIRPAAVAGRFYPGNPEELRQTIREFIDPDVLRTPLMGAVIPHAGYMYSGHVAGSIFSRIEIPRRIIVLCPNHTGFGPPLSIMKSGAWQTPLGKLAIDEELANALMLADPYLEDDADAHRYEHAIEVQLPFLQYLAGPEVLFVPITVGTAKWRDLLELGNALAQAIRSVDLQTLIIASSDMNHYESDGVTRIKDRKAIDKVLALDGKGLLDVTQQEHITMCGAAATTAMLIAANQLGASRAELVKYATSGDVSGDFDRVVGYAGIAVA